MDNVSALRRAKTWEISESEDESEADNKPTPEVKCQEEETTQTKPTPSTTVSTELEEEDAQNDQTFLPPLPPPPPPPKPSAGPGAPRPTRKRRSKEQMELDQQKVQERKEARERAKTAKIQEREEKRAEQQRRREDAQQLKTLRPENCLKSLTLGIDPALLQQEGADVLLGTLSSLEWKFVIESQHITHSVTWRRRLPEDGDVMVEEEQVLLVIGWSDFLDLVAAVKGSMLDTGGSGTGGFSFLSPLLEFLNREANKVVTILITDSPLEHTEYSYEGNLASDLGMDQLEIEEVLVHLQLHNNVSLLFLDGWQSVTNHVVAVTKALSKRPYKLLTERSELPFCVDGSWAGGARVERGGSGLEQVWTLQLQQLNRVSGVVAATVTAAYRSPRLLMQAYQKLETEEERKCLLAGLMIKTGGKERRIGPEISSRVYRCFTSQNPQLVLD